MSLDLLLSSAEGQSSRRMPSQAVQNLCSQMLASRRLSPLYSAKFFNPEILNEIIWNNELNDLNDLPSFLTTTVLQQVTLMSCSNLGPARSDCTLNVIPSLGGRVLMPLTDGGMQYLIGGADLFLRWDRQRVVCSVRCQSQSRHQEGQICLRSQSRWGPQSFWRSASQCVWECPRFWQNSQSWNWSRPHSRRDARDIAVIISFLCFVLFVGVLFVLLAAFFWFSVFYFVFFQNGSCQGPQRSFRTSVSRNLVRVGFSLQVRMNLGKHQTNNVNLISITSILYKPGA